MTCVGGRASQPVRNGMGHAASDETYVEDAASVQSDASCVARVSPLVSADTPSDAAVVAWGSIALPNASTCLRSGEKITAYVLETKIPLCAILGTQRRSKLQ